jgi:hypothetical protein
MNRTEQLLARACANGVKGLTHDDPSSIEKTRLMVNVRFWLDAVSGNKHRFKPDAVPMAGPAPDEKADLLSRSSYECGLPKSCETCRSPRPWPHGQQGNVGVQIWRLRRTQHSAPV